MLGCNYLLTIPSTPFNAKGNGAYSLDKLSRIVLDSRYAQSVNTEGQSLIPPTLKQFAETFQGDLQSVLGIKIPIIDGSQAKTKNDVFLTLDTEGTYLDAAGRHTAEGFTIMIDADGIVISGASPLGAWWGTRSLIQAAVIHDGKLPYGSSVDAPGWGSRGAMVRSRQLLQMIL